MTSEELNSIADQVDEISHDVFRFGMRGAYSYLRKIAEELRAGAEKCENEESEAD